MKYNDQKSLYKKYNSHFPSPKTSNGLTAAATPTRARATLPAAPSAEPAKFAPVIITPKVPASPFSSLFNGAAFAKTPTKAIKYTIYLKRY